MKSLFSLLALTCSAESLAAQATSQVGGWTEPIWETHGQFSLNDGNSVMDCTGDGIQDILVHADGYVSFLIDGKSGAVWASSDPNSSWTLADVHDLDGDGVGEVIWRYPNYAEAAGFAQGRIDVIQGGSGQLLWSLVGALNDQRLSQYLIYEDFDGDGIVDLLTWNPYYHTTALHGASGTNLWSHPQGIQYDCHLTPDRNQDGVPEIVYGSLDGMNILDGASGTPSWTVSNPNDIQERFQVVGNWDLNGDAVLDLVLRAPWWRNPMAGTEAGCILALDGVDGSQIWMAQGVFSDAQLGKRVEVFDANGDGTPDFLSLSREYQTVVNGQTGTPLWEDFSRLKSAKEEHNHVLDLTGDGIPDVLLRTRTLPGPLRMLDGSTGIEVWSQEPADNFSIWENVFMRDLDGDGDLDVVAGSPNCNDKQGYMAAMDAATGQLMWSVFGPSGKYGLGQNMHVWQPAGSAAMEVVARLHLDVNESGIRGYSGVDGSETWRFDEGCGVYPGVEWQIQDLNGDGFDEIIEYQSYYPDEIRIFEPAGRTMRNKIIAFRKFLVNLSIGDDVDGDGCKDLIAMFDNSWLAPDPIMAFSSYQNDYTTGLTLIGGDHSVANGGSTLIHLKAPIYLSNEWYRLLISGETGAYQVGSVEIPLADGKWLQHTLAAQSYPDAFIAPMGRLNKDAEANLAIVTSAGDLPAALAGTDVHICVLIEDRSGIKLASTGAETIQILP